MDCFNPSNSLDKNTPAVTMATSPVFWNRELAMVMGTNLNTKYFLANVFATSLEKDIEERKPESF